MPNWWTDNFKITYEPGHEKMCFMSYANNKGADQPAHPCRLISTFVVRCYYNISRFYSRNFQTLASFFGCAGQFVSGLVGNSRRHVLSCRGSYVLQALFKIKYSILVAVVRLSQTTKLVPCSASENLILRCVSAFKH